MHRPDTYVGSPHQQTGKVWVYDEGTERMKYREATYVPALCQLFEEILINAADKQPEDLVVTIEET